MKLRKKLIEVALPLEAINKASAREKSIRHGHPSTLHLWWARRPLAAARAVIFSQMVDDPSEYVDTLKSDSKLLRRAESELKRRQKVWEEAVAVKEKADAAGIESPEPGPEPTLDDIIAEQERDRLFKIIEELVLWENTTNETVLNKARAEIWQSWRRTCADNADHPRAAELFDRNKLPAFHDPFAGGGALPLEAQRLGLEAYASDLNPVAVLINKAMIEIPPKFAGMPPVNPEWQSKPEAEKAMKVWRGAEGLAEDVRYYGKWMRDEAEKRIGHRYPKIEVTEGMAKDRSDLKQYVGKELTVIAWIWARTVKSPNPAFSNAEVPLVSTFLLGTKPGKEVFVEPEVTNGSYRFNVKLGRSHNLEAAKKGTKLGRGAGFECILSGSPIPASYIKTEGKAGRLGSRLIAIVAEGHRGRVYFPATAEQEEIALGAKPEWRPEITISGGPPYLGTKAYGLERFDQIFSDRQTNALVTLCDVFRETCTLVTRDMDSLTGNSSTATADNRDNQLYLRAIGSFLGLSIGRVADYCSTICTWANNPQMEIVRGTFPIQALTMSWDFAEPNIFGPSTGSISIILSWIIKAIGRLPMALPGHAMQASATEPSSTGVVPVISTDPPYYDNVPYADLSDFFYIWLRRALHPLFPELFGTMNTPKSDELVAFANRHENKSEAESFFLNGMTLAMKRITSASHPAFPITVYYAFKQTEKDASSGVVSTGWEKFLEALMGVGLSISGTWPVRTERGGRSRGIGSNALASSIIMVCRKREENAATITRRDFVNSLKSELPESLRHLQRGNIAPVDLAQAAIGPGMAVYTRYEKVLDAEGKPLSVRDALALINQTLDEVLAEQEGDFDPDTRWALTWFEQFGFDEGEYGFAEQLSKAKNTSVNEMADPRTSPILQSKAGKVRLFRPEELEEDWTPESDGRLTVWDMVHQLIRVLEKEGESAAAAIVAKLGANAETARELCYRLYTVCERKKRAAEALSYNGLVQSWPEIIRLARQDSTSVQVEQGEMFD